MRCNLSIGDADELAELRLCLEAWRAAHAEIVVSRARLSVFRPAVQAVPPLAPRVYESDRW